MELHLTTVGGTQDAIEMQTAFNWFATFLLFYCFAAQVITLMLVRRVTSSLKSNGAVIIVSEVPLERFGAYGKRLRWLKNNIRELPLDLQKTVRLMTRIEWSAWASLAMVFVTYLGNNLIL